MPNTLYYRLVKLISQFIDPDKTEQLLTRQLERCGATPETLTLEQIRQTRHALFGALKFLVKELPLQEELCAKLEELIRIKT